MKLEESSVVYTEEMLEAMQHTDIPVAVYEYRDSRVFSVIISDGFCRLFGFKNKRDAYDLMDNNMFRGAHPDDVKRVSDASIDFAAKGGIYNVIYRTHTLVDSDMAIVHAKGNHITTEDGKDLCMVWYTHEGIYDSDSDDNMLVDAFSVKLDEDSHLYKSKYDNLTTLPNMTYFYELAEAGRSSMRADGKNGAIIFFDMCGMKGYNRAFGYALGDALLHSFAKILAKTFSNENCCRIGQDHFAVFTEDTNIEQVIETVFNEAKSINNNSGLPVRAGIYVDDPKEHIDVSAACDRAKMACDTLQGISESTYEYFYGDLLVNEQNRNYIVKNIDRAIKEEWIQVYFQPIVRVSNGLVCDEESLSRWNDPVKGIMSPGQFVPVLEEYKLIYKLDLFVLKKTLEKMKRQEQDGREVISGSINLSRSDFEVCDIVEEVRKCVDEANIPHNKINIEITESTVGRNFEYMKEQIDRFRSLGFKVWMDDFGSGYSTLDVLQKLDFDLIKFDMEFMRQFRFDNTGKSKIIITELMKLASSLGVDTITEGVEDESQAEFLREIGCSKIQGFYYSRPIPYEQTEMIYNTGLMNGVEDPRENEYYNAIGMVNLFDPSEITSQGHSDFFNNFDSLPMAIAQLNNDQVSVLRYTKSFKELMANNLKIDVDNEDFSDLDLGVRREMYINALKTADNNEDGWSVIDRKTDDNKVIHAFIRRIAVSPVTGATAYVAVGLVVNL